MRVSDHRLGDYDLETGDRLPFLSRFTRLTNAFSKKWENHHWAAVALWFAFYNRLPGSQEVMLRRASGNRASTFPRLATCPPRTFGFDRG
jgi:hypothetical protein